MRCAIFCAGPRPLVRSPAIESFGSRSEVERLSSAWNQGKIDDALACDVAMRNGNVCRCRSCGVVGIDGRVVSNTGLQEFHRQMQSHAVTISDCAHIPVFATAPREHGILADFAKRHAGFIPNRGEMLEPADLRFTVKIGWLVVPENPLKRAIADNGHGQLMSMGVLQAWRVVADRVVSRAGQKSREWNSGVVLRCWKVLVAANTFNGEEVGIGAGVSGGSIGIVDVEHQVMLCGFAHSFCKPRGVLLCAYGYKSDLDALQPPFLIEREKNIALFFGLFVVNVNPDADPMRAAITRNVLNAQRRRRLSVFVSGPLVRCVAEIIVLRSIPSGVEADVLDMVSRGEIDQLVRSLG